MADEAQLATLKRGVKAWNVWRREHRAAVVDLSVVDLRKANLGWANLRGANLHGADLRGARLGGVHLRKADLSGADLQAAYLDKAHLAGANLGGARFDGANLRKADLRGADLHGAHLTDVILQDADLADADCRSSYLCGSDLSGASLLHTHFEGADLTGCRIYGIAAWNLTLDEHTKQDNLVITPEQEPTITVDNLEVAQFVYLLLKNEKIRDVINTIGKKAVLILGRFTPEPRKRIVDAIRDALRDKGYVPIVFDFERPTPQTETSLRPSRPWQVCVYS